MVTNHVTGLASGCDCFPCLVERAQPRCEQVVCNAEKGLRFALDQLEQQCESTQPTRAAKLAAKLSRSQSSAARRVTPDGQESKWDQRDALSSSQLTTRTAV